MRETKLRMHRGDSASFDVRAYQADGVTPQALTGATVWFSAKNRTTDDDTAAVIRKSTVGGGVTIVDAAAGRARIDLAPADTSGFAGPVTLLWDVQARDGAGAVRTLAYGRLFVEPDVTRATA